MRDDSIHRDEKVLIRDEKVLISESLHYSLATSPLFLTFCLIAFESQLDPLEWSWEKNEVCTESARLGVAASEP